MALSRETGSLLVSPEKAVAESGMKFCASGFIPALFFQRKGLGLSMCGGLFLTKPCSAGNYVNCHH